MEEAGWVRGGWNMVRGAQGGNRAQKSEFSPQVVSEFQYPLRPNSLAQVQTALLWDVAKTIYCQCSGEWLWAVNGIGHITIR